MTQYTEFIKSWAQKHNKSYMCAATDPRAREEYYGSYPKRPTKSKLKQNREAAVMGLMDMKAKAKESAAAKDESMSMGGEDINRGVIKIKVKPKAAAKDAAPPERNSDLARYNESKTNPAAGVLTNPDLLRMIGSYTNPNIIREAAKYGLSVKDAEDIKNYNSDNTSQQEHQNSYWSTRKQMRGPEYREHWASIARGEKLMKKTGLGLINIIKIIHRDDVVARKQLEKKRTAGILAAREAEAKAEAEGLDKRGGIKTTRIYYNKLKKNFSYDANNNVYDDDNELFGKLVNGRIIKNRKKKN